MINILLFGNRANSNELGRFSSAIIKAGNKNPNVKITSTEIEFKPNIVIYSSRSRNQLKQAVNICGTNKVPLLVLSTDIRNEIENLNTNIKIKYLPNASSKTIKFIESIRKFSKDHPDWKVIEFTEWHQEAKSTKSGTAIYIAELINFNPSNIKIIRNDSAARIKYNIPNSEVAFAIHIVKFKNKNTKQIKKFRLVTIGLTEYAEGAITQAIKIAESN